MFFLTASLQWSIDSPRSDVCIINWSIRSSGGPATVILCVADEDTSTFCRIWGYRYICFVQMGEVHGKLANILYYRQLLARGYHNVENLKYFHDLMTYVYWASHFCVCVQASTLTNCYYFVIQYKLYAFFNLVQWSISKRNQCGVLVSEGVQNHWTKDVFANSLVSGKVLFWLD
jgi:hypothetical protein